jgi:hypothetical protein
MTALDYDVIRRHNLYKENPELAKSANKGREVSAAMR